MALAHQKGSSTRKLSEVFPEQSFMEKDEAIDQVVALDRQTRIRTRAGYPKCGVRSLPAAFHASRQPLIGLSSRVNSGDRARLVFPGKRILKVACPGGQPCCWSFSPGNGGGFRTGRNPPPLPEEKRKAGERRKGEPLRDIVTVMRKTETNGENMTSLKHIRQLAGRHVERLQALELLQQAVHATTTAAMTMATQSAEARSTIQDAADAIHAAPRVVRRSGRADDEERLAMSDDEQETFDAMRDAITRRLANSPELPETDI